MVLPVCIAQASLISNRMSPCERVCSWSTSHHGFVSTVPYNHNIKGLLSRKVAMIYIQYHHVLCMNANHDACIYMYSSRTSRRSKGLTHQTNNSPARTTQKTIMHNHREHQNIIVHTCLLVVDQTINNSLYTSRPVRSLIYTGIFPYISIKWLTMHHH